MVDTTGAVISESVISSGYADTDSAAARYARRCRFEPYRYYRTGRPAARASPVLVPFRHPTSANLVPEGRGLARAEGLVADSLGRAERIIAYLRCAVALDSVSGAFRYSYDLESDSKSRAKLLYFAMYPVEPTTANEALPIVDGPSGRPSRVWSVFRGCSGHIDVFGWMAGNNDPKADPRAYGLDPGAALQGFGFESVNPPEVAHWIAGGGRGCGPACFPWADSCYLGTPLAGTTFLPGCGLYAHGSLSGEVSNLDGYPVPGARVAVLGAVRETTTEANGSYFLRDLPPGWFRVHASAAGFDDAERWVEIGSSQVWCNLKMKPSTNGAR